MTTFKANYQEKEQEKEEGVTSEKLWILYRVDVRASVYKPESADQNALYISLNRKKKFILII